jgi:hypothetical protein
MELYGKGEGRKMSEPVAYRYDFDGYGYQYIDSGSGSDWETRIKNAEPLYTHPPTEHYSLSDKQIDKMVSILRQQAKEISSLKKQIHQLSISREPKIGDRVILLDDESEGVIESLSIAGGPRINFDDGAYGNYTRLELVSLFAYKEKE